MRAFQLASTGHVHKDTAPEITFKNVVQKHFICLIVGNHTGRLTGRKCDMHSVAGWYNI
jgi:hypothetical protein